MPTFITEGSTRESLMGDPEKRVDTAPDGTLWLCVSEVSRAKFFFSKNGGATWKYASGSDMDFRLQWDWPHSRPSFFIDREGYAHCSWCLYGRNPQVVRYARGRPRSGGGWAWSEMTLTPNSGRSLMPDTDLIVMKRGSGWAVFIVYNLHTTNPMPRVARIDVSAGGTLTLNSINFSPADIDTGTHPTSALEFTSTGDGKTPAASPHLWLASGTKGATAAPLVAWRAAYASGSWSWGSAVTLDSSVRLARTQMAAVHDGERFCVVWSPTSRDVRFAEWDGSAAPVRRDLPAIPVEMIGEVGGVSIAHDPVTDDLYVVAWDTANTNGDPGKVYSCKLTRAGTPAWGAWTLVANKARTSSTEGKAQLVRHAQGTSVHVVYAEPKSAQVDPGWKLYHETVALLTRKPPVPVLRYPANGERLDLASGVTFGWEYVGTGAGDEQQAWQFQRKLGTNATEYWNDGAKTWGTTSFWNAGAAQSVSFPAGAWASDSYTWTVRTRSASGQDSDAAGSRLVVGTVAPLVDVTGPVGILFGESTAVVTWDYVSTDAQVSFEVRLTEDRTDITADGTPYLWESGPITSSAARSYQIPVVLEDQHAYRVYVRASSSAGMTSSWDYTAFSLSLAPPSGPLVEVTPEWSYPHEVPRARLRLTAQSNLMSADQAIGTTGWEGYSGPTFYGTVGAAEADSLAGIEAGMVITATADGDVYAVSSHGTPPVAPVGEEQPLGPLDFPVQEGETYTALGHCLTPSAIRGAALGIHWMSRDDTQVDATSSEDSLGDTIGDQHTTDTIEYRLVTLSVTAPPGAVRARVIPIVRNLLNGEKVYWSRLSFHPGADERWQPGGYSDTQTLRVERSADGGATWESVVDTQGVDSYQKAVVRDRLMPLGSDVLWRAFTDVNGPTGGTLTSASSPEARLAIDSDSWVIRDPADEEGEVNAFITDHARQDETTSTVTHTAGREFPVVDTEGTQGGTGSLTLYVPASAREQTIELLRRDREMMVQSPIGARYRVVFLQRDYESLAGSARDITASYVEVR